MSKNFLEYLREYEKKGAAPIKSKIQNSKKSVSKSVIQPKVIKKTNVYKAKEVEEVDVPVLEKPKAEKPKKNLKENLQPKHLRHADAILMGLPERVEDSPLVQDMMIKEGVKMSDTTKHASDLL